MTVQPKVEENEIPKTLSKDPPVENTISALQSNSFSSPNSDDDQMEFT